MNGVVVNWVKVNRSGSRGGFWAMGSLEMQSTPLIIGR